MDALPLVDRPAPRDSAPDASSIVGIVLTRNEVQHIAACIGSLRKFLSRIVVLDSGSTDGTREIARACGAWVVLRPFADFASQRQAALDLVRAEWVLFVDADERIPAALAAEIIALCKDDVGARAWAGATMPRRNYIVNGVPQWGGFSPDRQLRLLRPARSSYVDSPPVHERPTVQGRIYALQHAMIHFNYRTWDQFHAKQRRYAALEARRTDWRMPWPVSALTRRFLRLFYYRYIALAGWKDGLLGFRLALCLAWYYGPLPMAMALFATTTDTQP